MSDNNDNNNDKTTRGPTKAQLEADRVEFIRLRRNKDIAFLTELAHQLGQSNERVKIEAAQVLWRAAASMRMNKGELAGELK